MELGGAKRRAVSSFGTSVAAFGRDQRHSTFDTSFSQFLRNLDGNTPTVEIHDWLVAMGDAAGCVRLKDTG